MNTLREFVEYKLTHCDKTAEANGYPLTMQNCKKNKKMRQLELYGNTVQDGTPTPDAPIEVQSVGEKSINLFDADSVSAFDRQDDGSYLSNQHIDSNIIMMENLTGVYTISGKVKNTVGSNHRPQFFYTDGTNSGNYIHATGEYVSFSVTSNGKDISKIAWNFSTAGTVQFKDFQIVKGNIAPEEYEPYGKYKIPVTTRGINLFSMAKCNATSKTINGITFTPLDDERVHIKGKVKDTSIATDFRLYPKTRTYIDRGTYRARLNKYTWNGLTMIFNISNGTNSININASSEQGNNVYFDNGYLNFIQLHIGAGYAATIEFDDIIELQLIKGTQNPTYEPYVEPIMANIFLDEPLRKLGDYADYIDFKENKVVRKIKEMVFKGGEIIKCYKNYVSKGFYLWQTSTNMFDDADLSYFSSWTTNNFPEKSTHLIACINLSSDAIKPNNWYINRSYGIHIALSPETYASDGVEATIADINNWLASQYESGTPVTFYYILAAPIEEPIPLDLPKLKAKTSIIEVDTSLAPSNVFGKYIKK